MTAAKEITAAVLEVPHRFHQAASQLAWIAANLPEADLVVLPEAAITGYVSRAGSFDLKAFAEPRGGAAEQALCALAKARQTALVAPLIERDGLCCYNSALFIEASGDILVRYRKRHPWIPETWATPGAEPLPLIRWRGLTFTLAICFDINFLLEESMAQLLQADVLLFPSAWAEENDSRRVLLPEIAQRSGCMLVNANWGVGIPRVPGQGDSLIVSAEGEILAHGGPSCRAPLVKRL